ncbi:MAG: hypothetical protein ACKOWF_08745 [Chloroflexota bacterium]
MLDQYRELIDELLGAPRIIRGLAGGGALPPEAGLLVAEMRVRDQIALARLNLILRAPDPRLPDLTAPPPAAPGPDLLAEAESARGDLVSLLMNLTLKDWERTALDAAGAETTLSDEVERHVEFDEAQLDRIRAAVR